MADSSTIYSKLTDITELGSEIKGLEFELPRLEKAIQQNIDFIVSVETDKLNTGDSNSITPSSLHIVRKEDKIYIKAMLEGILADDIDKLNSILEDQ